MKNPSRITVCMDNAAGLPIEAAKDPAPSHYTMTGGTGTWGTSGIGVILNPANPGQLDFSKHKNRCNFLFIAGNVGSLSPTQVYVKRGVEPWGYVATKIDGTTVYSLAANPTHNPLF